VRTIETAISCDRFHRDQALAQIVTPQNLRGFVLKFTRVVPDPSDAENFVEVSTFDHPCLKRVGDTRRGEGQLTLFDDESLLGTAWKQHVRCCQFQQRGDLQWLLRHHFAQTALAASARAVRHLPETLLEHQAPTSAFPFASSRDAHSRQPPVPAAAISRQPVAEGRSRAGKPELRLIESGDREH
jgi:hypothetical protein